MYKLIFFCMSMLCWSNVFGVNTIVLQPTAQVVVSPRESDNFTLQFTIQNNNISRDSWGLGYFMFHTLIKQPVNIQICENNTDKPSQMEIVTNNNRMIGHVQLIKPSADFLLKPNTAYTIKISGLKNIPKNISMMPQRLFFYDFTHKKYSYINVTKYMNTAYNKESAINLTKSIIKSNWNNSKKIPLDSYIIPTPVSVKYGRGNNAGITVPLIYHCLDSDVNRLLCGKIKNQPEGYVLNIKSNVIEIYINTQAGVFYANQSIKQLQYYYGKKLPIQTVIDYPRFKYRGVMLDTARHFFSVNTIKKLLDIMAENKLNTLHWHLADDEAWRVELAGLPQLTKIGSIRGGNHILSASNLVDEKYDITNYKNEKYENIESSYKGHYSIKDIKMLIKYANLRQITIIPEIEMPGHALSLKKSLSSILFDNKDSSKYISVQGYTDNVLPVCKYNVDEKFTLTINDITKSVAELFNHQDTIYSVNNEISLSGDELPQGAYSASEFCKLSPWKSLDSEDIAHLFFNQLSNNLPNYKLSGWQQLVQNDDGIINEPYAIKANNIGHIWVWIPTTNTPVSGYTLAKNLLNGGYPIVLDFADFAYLDIRHAPLFDEPGLYWAKDSISTYDTFNLGSTVDILRKKYKISEKELNNILGVEGAMWSEVVPTPEHLWYMLLPNMISIAEVGWVNENNLNWRNFATKLGCGDTGFLHYLHDVYRIRYRGYPHGMCF